MSAVTSDQVPVARIVRVLRTPQAPEPSDPELISLMQKPRAQP